MSTTEFTAVASSIEPTRLGRVLRHVGVSTLVLALVTTLGLSAASSMLSSTPEQSLQAAEPPVTAPEDGTVDAATLDSALATVTRQGSPPLPERTSRLIPQAPERLLDTRGDGAGQPAADIQYQLVVPARRTAVALSISLIDAAGPGAVVVDGRAGAVEAVTVSRPGATTTNLVFVPVIETELQGAELHVTSSAGGHLVVDLVATFEPSTSSSAGRFVPVDPIRLTRLDTDVDGRSAEMALADASLPSEAAAVLVSVEADVGSDGGLVRLGPTAGVFNQMLMWAPTSDEDRTRHGLALIEPSSDGLAAVQYDGGTLLTVEVIGYVTDETAEDDQIGLFVPSGPRRLFAGSGTGDDVVEVADLDPWAATAVLTIGSTDGELGQFGSTLLPVRQGSLTFVVDRSIDAAAGADPEAGDIGARVTLLGVFIGSAPS